MSIEVKPPELVDICGIGVGFGDTITADYVKEGILTRITGKIESYYIVEDEKMVVVKNIADPADVQYLKVKDITMFLEEFKGKDDYRFN